METKTVVKKSVSTVVNFGAGTLGLLGGTFVIGKVPAFGPPIVQKLLPGALSMTAAFFIAQKFDGPGQAIAFGLGLAGFANVVNKLTAASAGQDTVMGKLNKATAIPSLGYVQNYGGYPPEHFMYRSGNASVAMEGLRGMNAFKLQGAGDQMAWKLDGY